MGLNSQERITLTILGVVALLGLGVLAWQRRTPPLVIEGFPTPSEAAQSLDSASRPRSPRAERGTRREAGFRSTGQPRGASWDEALNAARQVDVNTAGAAALERLPGVGPTLARRIVEDREAHGPFTAPEELSRVKGIGPGTLRALREYVTIRE